MPVLISVIVILAPAIEAPPASVILPTNEPVTACPFASDEPNKRNIETARSNRIGLLILPSLKVMKWFYATAPSIDEAIELILRRRLSQWTQQSLGQSLCLLISPRRPAQVSYNSTQQASSVITGNRYFSRFLRLIMLANNRYPPGTPAGNCR